MRACADLVCVKHCLGAKVCDVVDVRLEAVQDLCERDLPGDALLGNVLNRLQLENVHSCFTFLFTLVKEKLDRLVAISTKPKRLHTTGQITCYQRENEMT